jgi:hypothetical protein
VHQHDRARGDARRARLGKGIAGGGFVERLCFNAVNADAVGVLAEQLAG